MYSRDDPEKASESRFSGECLSIFSDILFQTLASHNFH